MNILPTLLIILGFFFGLWPGESHAYITEAGEAIELLQKYVGGEA